MLENFKTNMTAEFTPGEKSCREISRSPSYIKRLKERITKFHGTWKAILRIVRYNDGKEISWLSENKIKRNKKKESNLHSLSFE